MSILIFKKNISKKCSECIKSFIEYHYNTFKLFKYSYPNTYELNDILCKNSVKIK